MARKQGKSKDEIVQNELRASANVAQDLARRLAAVPAPVEALKNISENIPTYSSLAKSAAEIAGAVSQASAVGEVMRELSGSLSKIDVKLPDISQRIQASLPLTLDDLSSQVGPSAEEKQINKPKISDGWCATPVKNAGLPSRLSQISPASVAGSFPNSKTARRHLNSTRS